MKVQMSSRGVGYTIPNDAAIRLYGIYPNIIDKFK